MSENTVIECNKYKFIRFPHVSGFIAFDKGIGLGIFYEKRDYNNWRDMVFLIGFVCIIFSWELEVEE